MPTALPVTFTASALPNNFVGTPQEFLDAIVARLGIQSDTSFSLFGKGAVLPITDQGPFLKDDQSWWVWDTGTGAYIPLVLHTKSLKYIVQEATPSNADYTIWVKTNASGVPLGVYIYNAGAWVDVYANTFGSYSTTAQMTTAISNAVAALETDVKTNYAFRANSTTNQPIAVTNASGGVLEVALTEEIDPDAVFSADTFFAPVNGYYHFEGKVHIGESISDVSGSSPIVHLLKNGVKMAEELNFDAFSTINDYRTIPFSTLIELAAGDEIKLQVECGASTGAGGTWNVANNNTFLAGWLVRAI